MTWLTIAWTLIKSNAGAVIGWLLGKWQTLLVAAGVVITAIALGWLWHVKQVSSFKATIETQINEEALREYAEKAAQAADESKRLQRTKDEAIEHAQERANKNAVSAANARSELGRLRNELAAAGCLPTDTLAACAKRAATATELLGACGERYTDVARAADGHANDVRKFQESWPVAPDTPSIPSIPNLE